MSSMKVNNDIEEKNTKTQKASASVSTTRNRLSVIEDPNMHL